MYQPHVRLHLTVLLKKTMNINPLKISTRIIHFPTFLGLSLKFYKVQLFYFLNTILNGGLLSSKYIMGNHYVDKALHN